MPFSHRPTFTADAPGYEDVVLELETLLSNHPPPFIYIHDPGAFKVTTYVVKDLLTSLASEPTLGPSSTSSGATKICIGRADAICSFSQRLLFESLIHSLVDYDPAWEDGCVDWDGLTGGSGSSGLGLRWNENVDSFLQGLRAAHGYLSSKYCTDAATRRGKDSKGKGKKGWYDGVRLVLLVERVERLRENMAEVLVPLARLQELTRLDLSVIFVSEVDWDNVKPPLGAAPDPYFIDTPPLSKENTVTLITSQYPSLTHQDPKIYHSSLQGLYSHFVAIVCDVCYPYTHDPQELQYIASARWPGFIEPIHEQRANPTNSATDDTEDTDIEPPLEDVRVRLIRLFTPSLSHALESLYPRHTNASDWAAAHEPEADLLSLPPMEASMHLGAANATAKGQSGAHSNNTSLVGHLPRLSKFILVASFLASTNPAKSDLRMFGRGLDEKKKRRRKTQATLKPKGGVTKVPQRLLGPSPFPLDRLIAILGSLLEENDADGRLPAPEFTIPGEYTEMEISRVSIYTSVQELTSSRLMHRTTKPDVIDGPPMFKCAISYEVALALSKELKMSLPDLMWEPLQ